MVTKPNNDPRWKLWAEALVTENCTLSIRKWSGKGKLFRRLEYERGIKCLLSYGFLAFRGERFGYRPKRARGWQYIIYMARGSVGLPPPLLETSSARFGSSVRRTGQRIHSEKHRENAEKYTENEGYN